MGLRVSGKFSSIITEIITFRAKILVPDCVLFADGLIQDLQFVLFILGFGVDFVKVGHVEVELKNVFKSPIASVAVLFLEYFVIVGDVSFQQ